MKLALLVAGPALAASHGVALPVTEDVAEARESGLAAIEMITGTVAECASEIGACAAMVSNGWEEPARCLIENFDSVNDEACRDRVENVARHFPLALFASGRVDPDDPGDESDNDFGKRVNKGCNYSSDVLPYVWSYHLHIQWEPLCKECKETALNFTDRFIQEFQPDAQMCRRMAFLTDLWNTDSVPIDDQTDHHFASLCKMATLPPGGPFLHSEKGFTLSTTMFHRVLPWLMANRPANDKMYMLVHPNTGCQYNDLKKWSLWVSPSVDIFYGILKGCVWASCFDQVLGCIAFNHLRPSQGYGQCLTPPSEYSIDCNLTLGAGNTSTETCEKKVHSTAV